MEGRARSGPALSHLGSTAVEQLVGREAESQAVRAALGGPAPVAVVLEGDAGIGKSALWEAGISEAAARGMRVLAARPVEAETGLSHAALGDLLGAVVDELPGDFPAPQRSALEVALLRKTADAGSLDPRAVGAATLGALRAAAGGAPVLIAVDDIQWLDPASAAAMRFALRRLDGGEPVRLLATRRTQPGAAPLDTGLAHARLTRIAVGPLGSEAVRRMLGSRLGSGDGPRALERVAEVSGGNPYFALELARATSRKERAPAGGAELPLPDEISAILEDRLGELPRETRTALGIVAAMGHPTIMSAAETVDPGVLDPAFEAGILHEAGDAIRFDHPLLAEAAYRMLAPSKRRAAHERLAATARDPERRARHLAAASTARDASVATAIERGAEAAAERGAPVAAAELLEFSARLEPDPDTAARRRITAVGHHMIAGDGERAAELGRALVDELPPGPLRSRALTAMAEQEGNLTKRIAETEQAVSEAGEDREALVMALLWHAVLLVYAGRHDEGWAAVLRARKLCGPEQPSALQAMTSTIHGYLAYLRGDPDALELVREAASLRGDDLLPTGWSATVILGRILMCADELDEARPILEGQHRKAVELGQDESRDAVSLFLAELEMRAGRLQSARPYAEDRVGASAMLAAYEGNVELAREIAGRGLADSEAADDAIVAAAHRTVLGFVELSLGNDEAALRHFGPTLELFLAGDGGDPGLRHNIIIPDAIESLIALCRTDEAERALGAWERAGKLYDRPRMHATAARCRALMAAAEGDVTGAIGTAELALEHHRDLPVPFERARTLIVLGALHRRAKRKAAARAALEEALAILEQIGVPLWAERARAELGRIGGRAQADGLTPTEQRVADLVAEGRSNKQVAGELFVSVRTVEANLTRVYAKLGIRSRTELAATRQASDGRSRSPVSQPAPPS
jgi:DNA-binding CsgD family transcriptional regulator